MAAPSISTHLAVLNLFREADGAVEITVAEARGAMAEPGCRHDVGKPIDYVERLIVEAAARIEARRPRGRVHAGRRVARAAQRAQDGSALGPSAPL